MNITNNLYLILCASLIIITIYSFYDLYKIIYNRQISQITYNLVIESGWITTISTGLGVFPFLFTNNINKSWIGICNALACGMMISASSGLILESTSLIESLLGALFGTIFIFLTTKILDKYDDVKFNGFTGIKANKMLLLIAVMTAHSFAEGISIGISFSSYSGLKLGMIITSTLAIHNIPEGIAISLVLIPQKVSILKTSLWCVFTSLPQPLMAIIAFTASQLFDHLVSIGLGFAAGAMMYVAIIELLIDSITKIGKLKSLLVVSFSICVMNIINKFIHDIY